MDDAGSLAPLTKLKQFQRLGPDGPIYEVIGSGSTPGTVAIRVLESGEEVDYRRDRAATDPEA